MSPCTIRKRKDAPVLACLVIHAEVLIYGVAMFVFGVVDAASAEGNENNVEGGIKISVAHGIGVGKFSSNTRILMSIGQSKFLILSHLEDTDLHTDKRTH